MPRYAALFLLAFVAIPQAHADGAKPSAGAAAKRVGWYYSHGAIRKAEKNAWEEKNSAESFAYREMDRNEHYVELYDKDRKLSVRLYPWGMYSWGKKTEKWHLVRPGRWDDPRKKTLDPALNSTERTHLQTDSERLSFPKLGDDFEVLAPASSHYNCIAWALGYDDRWVWPKKYGEGVSIGDFDALFGYHGYKKLGSLNYERSPGHDKLVLYTRRDDFGSLVPTHSARQLSDGSWSSKLGKLPLIRHLHPDDIDGGTYGTAQAVYVRARKK